MRFHSTRPHLVLFSKTANAHPDTAVHYGNITSVRISVNTEGVKVIIDSVGRNRIVADASRSIVADDCLSKLVRWRWNNYVVARRMDAR